MERGEKLREVKELTRASFLPVNDCDARTDGSAVATDTPEALRISERRREALRRIRKDGGRAAAWPSGSRGTPWRRVSYNTIMALRQWREQKSVAVL